MEMQPSHFHYHPSSPPGEDQMLAETRQILNESSGNMLEDIQMTNRQSSYISFLLVDQVLEMIRSG
jgi:hypothetical protein